MTLPSPGGHGIRRSYRERFRLASRSVLLIENVRLGRYQIGLTSDVPSTRDLIHHPVIIEPMVLVRPARAVSRRPPNKPLITTEPTSITWRAIEPLIRTFHADLLLRDLVTVESFSAALQMVKAGFGDGLAPLGLVREMRFQKSANTGNDGFRIKSGRRALPTHSLTGV